MRKSSTATDGAFFSTETSASRTVRQRPTSPPASLKIASSSIEMKKSSSTTRMRAPVSGLATASGAYPSASRSMICAFRQRYLDRADKAAWAEIIRHDRVGYAALDQRGAEAGFRPSRRRASLFTPYIALRLLFLPRNPPPGDMDGSARPRQRAVFGGVGREFVHDQAERRRKVGRQQHRLAFQAHPVGIFEQIGFELAARQRAEIGAFPFGLDEKIVRGGERRKTAAETGDEILPGIGAQRLRGDRLNHGQRVLDAMGEFGEQQALPLLPFPALGNVLRAFEDEPLALDRVENQAAFDGQFAPAFCRMLELAVPTALVGELLAE